MSLGSLVPHVSPEKFRDLKEHLEDLSRPSGDFFFLLIASTMIASLGLFGNSAAVIIGAVIIAPLMRPLLGLAFGSLMADPLLLRRSLIALCGGSIAGIAIAYVVALVLRSIELTPLIMLRTKPTLIDLGVAICAGAVAAYYQTKERRSDTLAGVAVAVALVPPLSVVGIGLARGAATVWKGASLLFATNLVGITIAAALVFLIKGYTPLRQAKQLIAVSTIILAVLVIPLAMSMRELIIENQLSRQIEEIFEKRPLTLKTAKLKGIEVQHLKDSMEVIATVYGSETDFNSKQVKAVEDILVEQTGVPITFHLRIIPLKEVTAFDVTPSGESEVLMNGGRSN